MANHQFKEAAFRHRESGEVVPTGACHNVDALPDGGETVEDYDAGFVDDQNQFFTRAEAQAAAPQVELASDGVQLQSADLFTKSCAEVYELSKSVRDYSFEPPTLEGNKYIFNVRHKSGKNVGQMSVYANATNDPKHPHYGYHRIGQSDISALHRGQGLYGHLLQHASAYVKHNLKSKGLVSEGPWRSEAATGAWEKLGQKVNIQRVPSKDPDAPDFRMSEKENDSEFEEHEWLMAFKAWIQRRALRKDESALMDFIGLSLGNVSSGDHSVAAAMSGHGAGEFPEFRAARFIANSVHVDPQTLRLAFLAYEHDLEMAALFAYNLPRTETNREILRGIVQLQELEKSEIEVAAIPRVVQPVTSDDEPYAKLVQDAFAHGKVHSVNLGTGKHSKGTAIAASGEQKLLLKPGSGPLSPASGIREQSASQSRREAGFSRCAELMGLEEYVPHAELLLIDGNEVAAIDLIDSGYKNLNEKRRDKSFHQAELFDPYRDSGDLFKWAVLDYVLGSIDRHAGNVMVGPECQVKLIDAGSSMAGFGFTATDSKSFIPCYLRAWTNGNFRKMLPEERLREMPRPSREVVTSISQWIDGISPMQLAMILDRYGILHDPIVARLNSLTQVEPERRVEYVLEFWAGLA